MKRGSFNAYILQFRERGVFVQVWFSYTKAHVKIVILEYTTLLNTLRFQINGTPRLLIFGIFVQNF